MYGYEIFHQKIMTGLLDAVRAGRAAHAYIFEGDIGAGVGEAAALFAKACVCQSTHAAPCGICESCTMVKNAVNPDVVHVAPAAGKKSIGVDEIEAMSAEAYIRPVYSPKKVFVFEHAEQLTQQAQNKMLKLIEEPPAYAVFVLIIPSAELLLPTVQSRCVKIRFAPAEEHLTEEYIKRRHDLTDDEAEFYARYSDGRPFDADTLIDDESFATLRHDALANISKLFSNRLIDAFDTIEFFEKHKDDAADIIDIWISFVRDIIAVQNYADEEIVNADCLKQIRQTAAVVDEVRAVKTLHELGRTNE